MSDINTPNLLPATVSEASELLKMGYTPVAGGTDLIVRRHAVLKSSPLEAGPGKIFSCRKIEETKHLYIENSRLHIGSSVCLADIISFDAVPPILREALLTIAAPGIRNAATLAGNICNASPAADSLPALYVLNAEIICSNGADERTIPIETFITGPGKTLLNNDEIVVSISCEIPGDVRWTYRKVGTRAANALSKISIASIWKLEKGIPSDFRLAVGACAPTVIRKPEIEKMVISDYYSDNFDISAAVSEYSRFIVPIDDQRSTARYRKNTALKLVDEVLRNPGD